MECRVYFDIGILNDMVINTTIAMPAIQYFGITR